ncbi:MAG: hypothetical protein AAFO82_04615 [Bacteroidota bacterium]
MKNKILLILTLAITSSFCCFCQIKGEGTYIIQSDHPDLFNLALFSFEGKPRLGLQYYTLEDRYTKAKVHEENFFRFGVISTDLKVNLDMYLQLVRMNISLDYYDQINTNKLHSNQASEVQDNKASYIAQKNLLWVCNDLVNVNGINEYFCKSPRTCKKRIGFDLKWGGLGADEFTKLEAFQSFAQEVLPSLKTYAKKISTEAALVVGRKLPAYDFDKNGFLINTFPGYDLGTEENKIFHNPVSSFEKVLADGQPYNLFLEIEAQEANNLLEELGYYRMVYLVYDIEFFQDGDKYLMGSNRNAYLSFKLKSPVIRIFKGVDLKNQIGELDLSKR